MIYNKILKTAFKTIDNTAEMIDKFSKNNRTIVLK